MGRDAPASRPEAPRSEGLVEDTPETHPQAEAAAQFDGVHKSLPFWTAEPRLYLVEKVPIFVGDRQSHLWTAW